MKILIVDDKEDVRFVMKLIVADANEKCTIIESENGEEAVQQYEKHNPDIVFMDMLMPKKDGFEAINEIVAKDSNAWKKIYIISAIAKKGQITSVIKEGKAMGVMSKPPEIEDILTIVNKGEKKVKRKSKPKVKKSSTKRKRKK